MDLRTKRFLGAWQSLGDPDYFDHGLVLNNLSSLELDYRQKGRYYHDLNHIDDCLNKADALGLNPHCVLALFYHDAVYTPGNKDNEQQSADLFEMDAAELGCAKDDTEFVSNLILATKYTKSPANEAEALVMDIDMSGLAANWETFKTNDANIRKEYGKYTDEEWKAGRTAFLKGLLAKPQIFYSEDYVNGTVFVPYHGLATHEAVARANIEQLLKEMES